LPSGFVSVEGNPWSWLFRFGPRRQWQQSPGKQSPDTHRDREIEREEAYWESNITQKSHSLSPHRNIKESVRNTGLEEVHSHARKPIATNTYGPTQTSSSCRERTDRHCGTTLRAECEGVTGVHWKLLVTWTIMGIMWQLAAPRVNTGSRCTIAKRTLAAANLKAICAFGARTFAGVMGSRPIETYTDKSLGTMERQAWGRGETQPYCGHGPLHLVHPASADAHTLQPQVSACVRRSDS